MRLRLENGYPYPFPEGFDASNPDYDCQDHTLIIEGVKHFEWKHTITVEFVNADRAATAKQLTNWTVWDSPRILEADASIPDGYDHPAIIVKNMAYCGFALLV